MRDCAHWGTLWKIWKWKDDLASFEWFWLNKLRRVNTYHGKLKSWKKCGWEILDNMAASITQHFLYLFIIAKWSSKYWAWPRHKPKPVQSVTMLRSNWPIIIIIIIITITITIIIIIIKIDSNDWIQISLYLPNLGLASSPPTSPTAAATVCFVWNCLHPSTQPSLSSSSTPPSSPRPPPTHSYCCIMFCLELPLPPYPYPPITSTKTTSHTHTHLDHHIPSTSTINIIIIVIITNFYLHIHQLNQPKHLKIVWQRFHPNALQCSAPFEVSLKVVVLGRILPAAVVKVMSRYIPPDIEQEANQYKFSAISLILECECVGFHSKENTKHVATDLQTFHVLLLFKFNQFWSQKICSSKSVEPIYSWIVIALRREQRGQSSLD